MISIFNDVPFLARPKLFHSKLRKHVFNHTNLFTCILVLALFMSIFFSCSLRYTFKISSYFHANIFFAEIYRIVSQKQLPEGPAGGGRPGGGEAIHIDGTHPESSSGKKPCCNN